MQAQALQPPLEQPARLVQASSGVNIQFLNPALLVKANTIGLVKATTIGQTSKG